MDNINRYLAGYDKSGTAWLGRMFANVELWSPILIAEEKPASILWNHIRLKTYCTIYFISVRKKYWALFAEINLAEFGTERAINVWMAWIPRGWERLRNRLSGKSHFRHAIIELETSSSDRYAVPLHYRATRRWGQRCVANNPRISARAEFLILKPGIRDPAAQPLSCDPTLFVRSGPYS